jgi:hypothetical protein
MAEWQDVAHDEEARRPAHTARLTPERAARAAVLPGVEAAGAGSLAQPAAADHPILARRQLRQMFASRRALRQAILLHEILGLPKALQRPTGGIAASPDAQAGP